VKEGTWPTFETQSGRLSKGPEEGMPSDPGLENRTLLNCGFGRGALLGVGLGLLSLGVGSLSLGVVAGGFVVLPLEAVQGPWPF
jgi:hypothetical protein